MIADTSFLISFFSDEDSNHSRAVAMMEKSKGKIIVLSSVLDEMFAFYSYRKGAENAVKMAERILRGQIFEIYFLDRAEWLDCFDIAKEHSKKVSLVDYQVAYLAKERDEELLCFDKQLNSLLKNLKKRE